jgi:hypothetical protein
MVFIVSANYRLVNNQTVLTLSLPFGNISPMENLLKFLNCLPKAERADFCSGCQTTERYLRKAISINQQLGEGLCIRIERESRRKVLCETLRPDVDWAYLRSTCSCCSAVPSVI